MEVITKKQLAPFLKLAKTLSVLSAFGFTALLLFKDIYFDGWEEKKETIIYSIPMVFLFFMWIRFRLDEENTFQIKLFAIDLSAVFLAAARILGLFWHSGHVLFILYTFLTTKSKIYRLLCIPFFALTAGFKIYWGDIWTPLFGGIIAVVLFVVRLNVEKNIELNKIKAQKKTVLNRLFKSYLLDTYFKVVMCPFNSSTLSADSNFSCTISKKLS